MVLVFKLFKVKNTGDLLDFRNTKSSLQGVDSEVSVTHNSRWLFNGWRRHNHSPSCPIHLSVTVASPSALQVSAPENRAKKSVQKGICKWNMLWTGLLCSRGKGEFSTHTLDFLFLFCILYPILAPLLHWKAMGKIDFTKAQDRKAHSAGLEDSQFPSIDVVSLNSSGVDACRGLVTASSCSSWHTGNWTGVTARRVGRRNTPENAEAWFQAMPHCLGMWETTGVNRPSWHAAGNRKAGHF